MTAGEVVGDGVLYVVDVGNPIVAAHIRDVEEVENVDAYPSFFEVAQEWAFFAFGRAYELVRQPYVDAFVSRHAEVALVASAVRGSGGQAIG